MAVRYDRGSKIDPELRGTVDFDFFESEDFDKDVKDSTVQADKLNEKDEDFYYDDDDDSFESDDQSEEKDAKAKGNHEKKTDSVDKKENEETKKERSHSPSPKRSDSPTPPEANTKRTPERNRHDSDLSESESDITDVSPLRSRDVSPRNSTSNLKKNRNKQKEGKSRVKIVPEHEGELDMEVLMKTIMKMEKERARNQKKNVIFIPTREPVDRQSDTGDKNYSFEKEKVVEIERENHRLLQKILNQHQRKNRGQAVSSQYAMPPCKRQFHSAVNRQKEQRRIEQENLKILNRLQNVKPSRDVSRHELLKETRKQAMYGIPVHTMEQRRHSDTTMRSLDETFEDSEWKGESQMGRLQQAELGRSTSKKKSSSSLNRPSSGRKRPEWNDRW